MKRTVRPTTLLPLAALLLSCVAAPEARNPAPIENAVSAADPPPKPEEIAPPPEVARKADPTPPLAPTDAQRRLDALLLSWLQTHASQRMYIAVDKPMYQPGETIWFSGLVSTTSFLLPPTVGSPTASSPPSAGAVGALAGAPGGGVNYKLISPRGSQVAARRVMVDPRGVAANDFPLPADLPGGEYTLRAQSDQGATDERKVIVASYETPRLKKTLEFLKKAYGPGDTVVAAVSVARGTGEPLAAKVLTAVATVDEVEIARLPVTTDSSGNVAVRFALPASIARGDALLTVSAEDGGVTESIQKRIPVLLKTVSFAMFPEGGDLVEGLPGRVYFAASNPLGKPADVQGRVVDDQGSRVANFSSLHDGMGRFALTPARGRTYHVEITRPTGIEKTFLLPTVQSTGCALQSLDDFAPFIAPEGRGDPSGDGHSKKDELRVAAWCTDERTVIVEAVLREVKVASSSAAISPGAPTVIALPVPRASQGAVRVTLLSQDMAPLAERLIYRGRGADLQVKVIAAKPKLGPRDPVDLTVETTDSAGRPVEANVALSVVDDTVLSLADDKTANILAHLYLEKELGDAPIEEPNFYFSNKSEAAASLDLLLGTRGWRRFDWKLVLAPPPPPTATTTTVPRMVFLDGALENAELKMDKDKGALPAARPVPVAGPPKMPARLHVAAQPVGAIVRLNKEMPMAGQGGLGGAGFGRLRRARFLGEDQRNIRGGDDLEAGGEMEQMMWSWSPVRQFPSPDYAQRTDGPRTDFRETIYWNPSVATGKDGKAQVRFYLSDAVTSFRATAEGRSLGGLPGRGDAVLQSKLPLSLEAKLPLEVSSGDTIRLPVTLSNESDRPLDATLEAKFGASFQLAEDPATAPIHLAAGERKTLFFALDVVGGEGAGEVTLAAVTDGLRDEWKRTIRVVPVGFPQSASFSGTVEKSVVHEVDLSNALPRTVSASVKIYPSPLSTMIQGAEGMLQEPSGCFEQTSSTNYPNVMVSQYLAAHDVADPALIQKTHGLLDRGYKRLTGFESPKQGYEWFGGDPGHEALTAYGILEFSDMQKIYGDVDRTMIDRTAKWLYSRRDGKGGYLRNPRALDSFGGAPAEVTDAYITWALTESGKRDLPAEIDAQRKRASETQDPYLVALAANTLLNAAPKDPTTTTIVNRLATMQAKDGSFPGAKTTITRSGGNALLIESTALATLALIKASPNQEHEASVRAAAEWLTKHDNGRGVYGSTQSTVLALRALNAYADHSRRTSSSGVASLYINGKESGRVAFEKGRTGAIVFDDVAPALVAGANTIEVRLDSPSPLPYAVSIDYRTREPHSSPEAKIGVSATLARPTARMGETIRLHARIENRTSEGQPMALARLGLPGGLTFQTWQLKELKDKGLIDFYETRQREVILYFRSMAPSAAKEIDLDLMAVTPGTYTAPASSAYLYYTNEHKTWASPVTIAIAP